MRFLLKHIVADRMLFLFTIFSVSNVWSYSSSILFGSTLMIPRLILGLALLILLFQKGISLNNLSLNVPVLFFLSIINLSFVFSEDFEISVALHLGSLLYILVAFFFVVYVQAKYRFHLEIVLFILFLSYLHIPFLLLFNPEYISLNLYGVNAIEEIGIKSRILGWSCALIIPVILYLKSKGFAPKASLFLIPVLVFFIIISGSRSSLVSLLVVGVLAICFVSDSNIKVGVSLIALFAVGWFLSLSSESVGSVSFYERQANFERGVADDEYRVALLKEAWRVMHEDMKFLFTGFGPGNINEVLSSHSRRFADNSLSSHNTYLEVGASYGLVAFLLFVAFVLIKPVRQCILFKNYGALMCLAPLVIISATENNFGAGQFLFLPLLLIAFSLGNDLRSFTK